MNEEASAYAGLLGGVVSLQGFFLLRCQACRFVRILILRLLCEKKEMKRSNKKLWEPTFFFFFVIRPTAVKVLTRGASGATNVPGNMPRRPSSSPNLPLDTSDCEHKRIHGRRTTTQPTKKKREREEEEGGEGEEEGGEEKEKEDEDGERAGSTPREDGEWLQASELSHCLAFDPTANNSCRSNKVRPQQSETKQRRR
mgnify:CR=1 FL=1